MSIQFPLNEVQLSLLRLTEDLNAEELDELKDLIIAYKAERLARIADQEWVAREWTEATMQSFLASHMRTPYLVDQEENKL
jgi:hypothetical protein